MRDEHKVGTTDEPHPFPTRNHRSVELQVRFLFLSQAIRVLMAAAMVASFGWGAVGQIGTAGTDDLDQCRLDETMSELRLKACTRVIEDSQRIADVRAEAFLNRGTAKEELGDIAGAIADYTEGLKLNPNYRQLYLRRGLAYEQDGKRDQAVTDFSQAIRLDPKDAEALIFRGLTYASQGDFGRALMDYDAAIAENPDDDMALVMRGEVREEIGQRESAIADYRRALELNPQNVEAKEGLERLRGARSE